MASLSPHADDEERPLKQKNSADVSRRPRSNPQVSQPLSGDGGEDAVSHRRPSARRTLSEGRRRCLSKVCRVYQGVAVRARRSNREHFHAVSALGAACMTAGGVDGAGGCAIKNSADVSRRPRSNPQVSQPLSGDGGGDAVSHRRPIRKTYFIGRDGAQASLSIAACIGMFRRSLLVAFQCILRRSPWRMRAAAAAIPLAVRPASSVSPALPWSQTAARTLSIVS